MLGQVSFINATILDNEISKLNPLGDIKPENIVSRGSMLCKTQ